MQNSLTLKLNAHLRFGPIKIAFGQGNLSKVVNDLDLEYSQFHYAPNFKEVEWAYWFGSVHACVHVKVTLPLGQEPLELVS